MEELSAVPKFGNWENEENVAYTTYFEKAGKGRTEGKMNQNDSPLHHDDIGHKDSAKVVLKTKHEHGGERRQRRPAGSPMHHDIDGGRVAALDSPLHRYGHDTKKKAMQRSAVSDLSSKHSHLHPQNQAKFGGNLSSLSWEKKSSSEGSHGVAPMTPARSQLRSITRGNDTPDHCAAVPKFGDWDETNPASADGFTHIFNRVREQRQGEAATVPVLPTESSHSNGQRQCGNEKFKSCCCFPWGR